MNERIIETHLNYLVSMPKMSGILECKTVSECAKYFNSRYPKSSNKLWESEHEEMRSGFMPFMFKQWSEHKVTYHINDELCDQLRAMKPEDLENMPISLLSHLPYEVTGLTYDDQQSDIFGEVATFDLVSVTYFLDRYVFDVLTYTGSEKLSRPNGYARIQLWVSKDATVKDLYEKIIEYCINDLEHYDPRLVAVAYKAIMSETFDQQKLTAVYFMRYAIIFQSLLYINSLNADLEPKEHIDVVMTKKNGKKERSYVKSTTVEVGYRIGTLIKQARSSEYHSTGTGSSKRPHARRGHWQHFWTGHHNMPETRKLILKWVMPLFVHGKDVLPTVMKVKKEAK